MYPNNEKPTNPADYLNQIAPQGPKKANFIQKKPILFASIGLVILIMSFIIIGNLSSGVGPLEQLAARLLATESTTNDATTKLKSTQLRTINSNLKSFLTNTIRDITPIIADENINIDKLDKKILSSESNTDMLAVLEDARLNVTYDRTYAREMAYQLDNIIILMNQINKNTTNNTLKTFLSDRTINLEPIQKDFADFNAANG
jgi:hypothetical protein